MYRDRLRAKWEGQLARTKPNTGHAKILRGRLGISDDPTPVVEPVVEEKKPRKKRKKKTTDQ